MYRGCRRYGKEEGLIVDFVGNTEKYKIVSLADLSTPKDQARILKGDEVRYRRNPLLPVTVVLEVKGFVDRQEEGDARIEMAAGWERVARDGWVRTADLVLAVNQEAGTEPEDIGFPVAIGANHFPVSLFGKSQTLWYCYESSGKKTFIAKGRGKVALIRKPEEKWEAWLREQEAENQWSTPELVKEGTFQECSAAVNVQTDVDKAWMEQPATDGQMAALKRFKVRRQGLTKGEASQILEVKVFQIEIEKIKKMVMEGGDCPECGARNSLDADTAPVNCSCHLGGAPCLSCEKLGVVCTDCGAGFERDLVHRKPRPVEHKDGRWWQARAFEKLSNVVAPNGAVPTKEQLREAMRLCDDDCRGIVNVKDVAGKLFASVCPEKEWDGRKRADFTKSLLSVVSKVMSETKGFHQVNSYEWRRDISDEWVLRILRNMKPSDPNDTPGVLVRMWMGYDQKLHKELEEYMKGMMARGLLIQKYGHAWFPKDGAQ
jgi:hypothetical protein